MEELLARDLLQTNIHLLRKLPVDFDLAPAKVIAAIAQLQPDIIVCCGMAERRSRLSIESNGKLEDEVIHTTVNVQELIRGLSITRVSHHAGKFVCNHTYYSVLKYIQDSQISSHCLFVHVPVLSGDNREAIAIDFSVILNRLIMHDSSPSVGASYASNRSSFSDSS